jgi:hypothetical protein
MLMPKAAMYEYDFAAPGENDIGRTRQVAPVDPEPVAQSMRHLPDNQLRLTVGFADEGHTSTHDVRNIIKRHWD